MRSPLKLVVLLLVFFVSYGGVDRLSAGEQDDRIEKLQGLLELAVDRFDLGKYVAARAALNKLIAENPTAEEAYRLRQLFGEKILLKMQKFGYSQYIQQSLGGAPLLILKRAKTFEALRKRGPEYIKSLVEESTGDVDIARKNMVKLSELGPYAVPELIKYLRNNNGKRAFNAHHILQVIGGDALLPLLEVLQTNDQLLLQQICAVVGEIRPAATDATAYLKDIYENPKNNAITRQVAGDALEKITGQDPAKLPAASEYYLRLAKKYYNANAEMTKKLESLGGVFWLWDQSVDNGRGGLVSLQVPSFLLEDLLAEEMVYRGMELAKNKEPFQILLAGVLMQEQGKIRNLKKIALESKGDKRELLLAEAKLWQGRLKDNLLIAYTLGYEHLLQVLSASLADNKDIVAIEALEGIALIAGKKGWNKISAKSELVGSLISALNSNNLSVSVAAAKTLVAIGLPQSNENWNKVVSVLVKGVGQRYTTIVEVVSADNRLAYSVVNSLERSQILSFMASSGTEGVAVAKSYPPKDVILLDNALSEFSALRKIIEVRKDRHNKSLPLIVITTKSQLLEIANQFVAKALDDESKRRRHLSKLELLLEPNASFTNSPWNVVVKQNVKPDQKNLLRAILALKQYDVGNQPIVIITNSSRKERLAIKERLLIEAGNLYNPAGSSEYSRISKTERSLAAKLPSSLPVFVVAEVAGFDAMHTLQKLRSNAETKGVPVAILTKPRWLKEVKAEYEMFEKEGSVKVIPSNLAHKKLIIEVLELKSKNKSLDDNYARELNNSIALSSAQALAAVKVTDISNVKLSSAEIKTLVDGLKNVNSPAEIRIAIADVLGHFRVKSALNFLKGLFAQVDKKESTLRIAMLKAIAQIDQNNEQIEFKLAAMRDEDSQVRKAAAKILAPAARSKSDLERYMRQLRPNNLLKLANDKKTKAAVK